MSIVVVGNGASLLGSNLGSRIDDHEYVVRLNMFHLAGYEDDVGRRTTHWCVGVNQEICRDVQQLGRHDCVDLMEVWTRTAVEWRWECEYGSTDRAMHSDLLAQLINVREHHELRGTPFALHIPSTGMMAIRYCQARYGVVSVAGFGKRPGHYFNLEHRLSGAHPNAMEREYLDAGIANGLILDLEA